MSRALVGDLRFGQCSSAHPSDPGAKNVSPDGWIVEISASRGLHRANIRVDGGAWIAPPGLASMTDDFAGEVGIFVVE